ncbi:MAG: type II toxin-antitoxin system death-on-curing family toxin [Proteobacteria bacterium]|nr:type II toxin-antitoxin system death-on-curing family toxin [Pseudomonadota bacterium]
MSAETVQFLSVDEALGIHEHLIEEFGGQAGVRDPGLLESSLFRPQTGYYEDLATMASALFESLLFNHAFHDGNERMAFFATDVFLRLNGWRLQVDSRDAVDFILRLNPDEQSRRAALLPLLRKSITR